MQTPVIAFTMVCLALLAERSVSAHAIDGRDHASVGSAGEAEWIDSGVDAEVGRKDAEARALDLESIFGGIAKSMVSRTGGTSSQNQRCLSPGVKKRSAQGFCKMSSLTSLSSPCEFFKMALGLCDLPDILLLSLNLSNVVLMLVLKGLIWGASYMQGHKGRNEGGPTAQDAGFTETDLLLFLGYLVADDSGRNDCLNRVACEHPARAESYLRSAEMVWKTAKMLDGVVPIDNKYEQMLIKLQEAIEDGRADGDCPAKYKCSDSTNAEEEFNLI